MVDEAPGDGPSFERHIWYGSFRQAAELCEAGDEIPVSILHPGLDACHLAAFLAERGLRCTRDGEFWTISDTHPEVGGELAQVTLQVAWPVMFLALLALLSTVACTPAIEIPPGSRQVEARAAVAEVLALYTGRQARPDELPEIWAVPSDCMDSGAPGFMHDGGCRGGMTDVPYRVIYVVDAGNLSWHVPHETLHLLGHLHDGLPTWPESDPLMQLQRLAERFLGARPELNRMPKER